MPVIQEDYTKWNRESLIYASIKRGVPEEYIVLMRRGHHVVFLRMETRYANGMLDDLLQDVEYSEEYSDFPFGGHSGITSQIAIEEDSSNEFSILNIGFIRWLLGR